MDMELYNNSQLIRKSMADFSKSVLEPIAYEDDRNARFPKEIIKEMVNKNYFGLTVSEEFGGNKSDFSSVAVMAEEFGKANGSAAVMSITHLISSAQAIEKYGNDEQKKAYLPDMVSGNKLGGYAFIEPGASIAAGANKVVAVKEEGSYLLTGKKTLVANGGEADVYVVIAQTNVEEGLKGLSAFIVDSHEVKVTKNIDKLGLRSFPTAELEFNKSKGQLLGKEGEGLKIANEIQALSDIAHAAIGVGIGKKALEESIKHSKTRVQFGFPISKLQAVQWMLAEMAEKIHTLDILAYSAAQKVDAGGDYINESVYLKMFAEKATFEIGTNAVQIHGGTGYSREANIERYFRDLRGLFNFDSINEYPQKIIAGNLLK